MDAQMNKEQYFVSINYNLYFSLSYKSWYLMAENMIILD